MKLVENDLFITKIKRKKNSFFAQTAFNLIWSAKTDLNKVCLILSHFQHVKIHFKYGEKAEQ